MGFWTYFCRGFVLGSMIVALFIILVSAVFHAWF